MFFLLDNINMEIKLQWNLSALSKQGKAHFIYSFIVLIYCFFYQPITMKNAASYRLNNNAKTQNNLKFGI